MFLHMVRSRLLVHLRTPASLFWNAAFPMILMSIFIVVILPIGEAVTPTPDIPVAVVTNGIWVKDPILKETIESVSSDPDADDAQNLFATRYADEAEAVRLLEDGDVSAILVPEDDHKLSVRVMTDSFTNSIVYTFANRYTQTHHVLSGLIEQNPMAAPQILETFQSFDETTYFEQDQWTDKGNSSASYFFAVIGMVTLYNMTFALREINEMMANQSPQGARLNVAPVKRSTLLAAGLTVSFILQYVIAWVMLFFLHFVAGITVLDYALPLALLMACATLCSIGLGLFLGVILPFKLDTKISVVIGISTFLSFLAGMMSPLVRKALIESVPWLARLNPAELMADSLFSIYFFNNPERLRLNGLMFLAIGFVAFVLAAFRLRRQDYESL